MPNKPETTAGTVYLGVELDSKDFGQQMAKVAEEASAILQKHSSGFQIDFSGLEKSLTNAIGETTKAIDGLGDIIQSEVSKSMEQGVKVGAVQMQAGFAKMQMPKMKVELDEAQLERQLNLYAQKWEAIENQRIAQINKINELRKRTQWVLDSDPNKRKMQEQLANEERKLVNIKFAAEEADAQVVQLERTLNQMRSDGADEVIGQIEEIGYTAESTGGRSSGAFSRMAQSFGSFSNRFMGMARRVVLKLRDMTRSFNLFNRSTGRASSGLSKMLRYGLAFMGIRSVYMMLRRIANTATDSFQHMGAQFADFQAKLDGFQASMGKLKGALGSMLAPIVEAILPTVNMIIDKLTVAFNALGMFFARLFGQTSYKQIVGYNAALSAGAGAANASNQAHKKLLRTLASFDELEILQTKDPISAGGGAGGGGATGGTPIYEEVAIEPLVGGLDLASLINGWIQNIDAENIGRTISDKFSSAFEAAYTFIEAIDWSGLGTSIGDAWNNIDWYGVVYGLGRTIFSSLKGLADLLAGWLLTTDWKKIGTNIGKAISDLDWAGTTKSIADAIWGALSGIVNLLSGFLQNTDWVKISSTIYDALAGLDWAGLLIDLAGLIGAGFGAALGVVWGLLKSAWNDVKEYWKQEFHENGRLTFASFFKGINTTFGSAAGFMTELVTNFGSALLHALGLHAEANMFTEMGNKAAEAFKKSFIDGLLTLRQNSPFYQVSFGPDSTAGQYQQHLEDLMDQDRKARGSGGSSGSWSSPAPPSTSSKPSTSTSTKGLTRFAAGGYIRQPTLAMIGEDYKREVALPLDRNTEWADILAQRIAERSGGGGGAQNVTIPVYLGTDTLVDVIEVAIDRQGRIRNAAVF